MVLNKTWPFPKPQIVDFFKPREFTDSHFEFDKNGKKVLQTGRKPNTFVKGEIARNKQFYLFPSVFKKICAADT